MDLPQQGTVSVEQLRSIVRRSNGRTIEVWDVLGTPRLGVIACPADRGLAEMTMQPFREAGWVTRHCIPFEHGEVWYCLTRAGVAALEAG